MNAGRKRFRESQRQTLRQLLNLKSKARFILSLTLAFAVALGSTAGFADGSHDIQDVLTGLQNRDPRVVSENAKKLANYPYVESEKALIALLENQVARGSDGLNTFIVSGAIEGLNGIGTSLSLDKLSQIEVRLQSLQVSARLNQRTKDALVRNLQATQRLMRDRQNPLPSGIKAAVAANASIKENEGVRSLNINGVDHEFVGDIIRKRAMEGNQAAKIVSSSATEFLTDSTLEEISTKEQFKIFGRDNEAKDALLTLVRMKGKNPIFVGPAGVGKTTIAQRLAQIITTELPANDLYDSLKDATIIETTPARISWLAKSDASSALEEFFDSVLALESDIRRPIVVFIDEIHTLSEAQIEAMKPYLDSKRRAIKLVGASTGREFNMAFKQNEAIKRPLELIDVKEFTLEQTAEIVRAIRQSQVEKRYRVKFSDKAAETIVRNSHTLLPDNGRFDGSIKIMQDIAIAETDKSPGKSAAIGEAQVNSFLHKRLGYTANPKDSRAESLPSYLCSRRIVLLASRFETFWMLGRHSTILALNHVLV